MRTEFGTSLSRFIRGGVILSGLEVWALKALVSSLPPELQQVVEAQFQRYVLVQREIDGRALNFYPRRSVGEWYRCVGSYVFLAAVDDLQSLSGIDDADALIAAQRQQMLAITGDDEIGLGGERTGKYMVIVGIVRHDTRHVEGFSQIDRLDVIGHDTLSGATDEGQLFAGGRSCQNFGEFFEQHGAAIELAAGLLAQRIE